MSGPHEKDITHLLEPQFISEPGKGWTWKLYMRNRGSDLDPCLIEQASRYFGRLEEAIDDYENH